MVVNDASGKVRPKDGDLAVCLYCGCIATYSAEMQLIRLPEERLQGFKKSQPLLYKVLIEARRACGRFMMQRRFDAAMQRASRQSPIPNP
jgi:hypothetical protein